MFRVLVYSLFMVFFNLPLFAQVSVPHGDIEGGTNLNVVYKKDYTGKIYIHTRGMGFSFRKSKHVTVQHRNFFEIDLSNLKHPKEMKTVGNAIDRKRFVYGKLNNVLLLRPAIGGQRVFYSKADIEAVEVRYSYSLGPTIAFLKPYYVQVYRVSSTNQPVTGDVVFNEETFTIDSIVGRSSFFTGFNEIKIYPGLTAKFNLSFEYAHYTNIVRAIETGISVDYFPKAIQIMGRNPSENVVFTLHVGFVFGRKYY